MVKENRSQEGIISSLKSRTESIGMIKQDASKLMKQSKEESVMSLFHHADIQSFEAKNIHTEKNRVLSTFQCLP